MIKVLQVHGGMERGGTESVIMNWYRHIDRSEIQFDFTTMQERECVYDKEIETLGGNIYYVPTRAKVGNLKHLLAIYNCIKVNGPFDAVHSHMNCHGGVVALAAKLAGTRTIVCHAHGKQDAAEQTIVRKVELAILRTFMHLFASNLLACSNEAGYFVFGEKAKFNLIFNAVDLERFKPIDQSTKKIVQVIKKEYNLDDTLLLGHVGRFYKEKNHVFIVDIIEALKNRNINFKFLFIGDGELKRDIFELIKEKKLQENVVDLGDGELKRDILNIIEERNLQENVVDSGLRDDVNIWLKVMDILIFPSLHEGLPMVLVEAQCSGLPCLVADTISSDVDLGLGLVKQISINNSQEIWVEEILSNNMHKITDEELIKEKTRSKGYNLIDNIKKMSDIYRG